MKRPGSKPCEGGCGRTVSANVRKCLNCVDKEMREQIAIEQYERGFIGTPDTDPHFGQL